ncbi:MAG: MotA/TolQ/ExbB proton channel family protein [Alphaproteobacteria bacterium]|nr:MotA/TolQ/ExbB proton channel family protein [Alphaproteobacteria bacterium]
MEFSEIIWLFLNPLNAIRGVRDFLEMGGNVLFVIMIVNVILMGLIYERFSYFRRGFVLVHDVTLNTWNARSDHNSWTAHRIREQLISIAKIGAQRNMGSIKALVALSPLLGLVGTVTGMVEVFDVMAITGSGNARAMAAGISKATLPTMAGLVTAVAGIAFSTVLERRADRAVSELEDKLILM